MRQTINLDCAPGAIRPGDLIGDVIAGTGLPAREPVSKFFGNWCWDYSDISPEIYTAAQQKLKERISKLYFDGFIRYGDW